MPAGNVDPHQIRGLPFDRDLALRVIAAGACENSTRGPGACLEDGRSPLAKYSADGACSGCIAWGALYDDRTAV